MADEIKPIGETPAAPVQGTNAPVNPPVVPPPAPAEPEEEFDKERAMATIKAQRTAERELRAQLKDYERLKAEEQKRVDAQLTETERLKKQADELAAKNAKLESDILRRDVASETGLPVIFADRLKGASKEEMLADAAELLKALPPQEKQKAPHLANPNPNAAASAETEAQKRERVFGKMTNIFDTVAIQEQGGGVVWRQPKE